MNVQTAISQVVRFSLCAESRFGESMWENFISRKLKLALSMEKKQNQTGKNRPGRTKLKKVLKTKSMHMDP